MSVRFSVDSEAAAKLCRLTFSKLQEVWAPDLEESAVAEYAVALVARGQERKKVHSQLKGVLGEEATVALLDWWVPAPGAAACVWGFIVGGWAAWMCMAACMRVIRTHAHARATHARAHTAGCSSMSSSTRASSPPAPQQPRLLPPRPREFAWGRA